jgi:hypothetical protein
MLYTGNCIGGSNPPLSAQRVMEALPTTAFGGRQFD